MSTELEPQPFMEYEVSDVGTVIAPDGEPGYRVRLPGGQVTGFPAASGDPCQANAAADIAYALAHPAPPPLSQVYAEQLAVGYVDTATGLHLKTTESAQAKFGRMLILLDLGVTEDGMTDETEVTLWDYADQEQTITVGAFRALMLRYGLHCKAIFDAYAP